MMLRSLVLLIALASPAHATPPEVSKMMGAATLSGQADVKFFGFNLYRAELWRAGEAFALSLTYRRGFSAKELADASIKEIARMENASVSAFADLGPLLQSCFADVREGDRITGASTGADTARFYHNGAKRCDVSYPQFRDRFFGIWLGAKTRDPKSRDLLLGRAK